MITLRKPFHNLSCSAAAVFIVAMFISCAAPSPQADNTDIRRERLNQLQKLNIYYYATSGKAGYHMVSQPRANCPVTWNSNNPVIVEGYLPPGLELDKFNIVGTPQQPGNWLVKIRFTSITCQGKSYPDQDVEVYFNIQGDAPRALE